MTVISSLTAIFTAVLNWFIESLTAVGEIFYTADGGLSLIGTVTLVGFSVGICTLILAWMRSLFHGRG